jgi:Prokaryotic membrane lipoprotein lipid attachment site
MKNTIQDLVVEMEKMQYLFSLKNYFLSDMGTNFYLSKPTKNISKNTLLFISNTMKKILLALVLLFTLSSCGQPVDIINPDAKFLYFYGATCPHCQELNAYMDKNDLYSQIALEKREVYYNTENNAMFLAKAKELGISESEIAVPFVLNLETNTYTIGAQPAIDQFEVDIATRTNSGTGKTLLGTGELSPISSSTGETLSGASSTVVQK